MKVNRLTYDKDKYYEKVITAVNQILPNREATCGNILQKRGAFLWSSLSLKFTIQDLTLDSLNSQSKTLDFLLKEEKVINVQGSYVPHLENPNLVREL